MASVTRDLIRRRAEHNDGEIFSLEELSLHQLKIDKIEHVDRWCPHLKILYLQGNNITKIENLGHLKKLEYLNLALNGIEAIEKLEGCESLAKLDLTANCIWKLSSCYSLSRHYALRELYLVGNPCTKYRNYRPFVIGAIQQLQVLDGQPVLHTERLEANLHLATNEADILQQEAEHQVQAYVPKTSFETQDDVNRSINVDKVEKSVLIARDGRVLNSNKWQIPFTLQHEDGYIILTIKIAKHVDTSLVDIDVQPTYIRALVKGRLLQLVLPAEVQTDQSVAQRSMATGHLVITMPTLEGIVRPRKKLPASKDTEKMADVPRLEPID